MSTVVKCNNCNVVINEVLAFICNKIDVMDEESISRICISAFSEYEVKNAKDLLYESISTTRRKKTRKRDGKTLREIDDIICLLKETDPEEIPIFVARDLQKLPPVLFDHVDVTRLLKDLLKMQGDIKQIKEQYVTVEQIQPLKSEFELLKNEVTATRTSIYVEGSKNTSSQQNTETADITIVNHKEGKKCKQRYMRGNRALHPPQPSSASASAVASANMRPEDMPNKHDRETNAPAMQFVVPESQDKTAQSHEPNTNIHERQPNASQVAAGPQGQASNCNAVKPNIPERDPNRAEQESHGHTVAMNVQMHQKSFADVAQEGTWKSKNVPEEWIQVQRKRYRNRFVGNRGKAIVTPDSNFKAAEIKIPIYIYNVAKAVTVCSITEYIQNKANIEVTMEKMNMTVAKDYDSYKIFIPRNKLDIFMEHDFWPEGIAFRRFVDFKWRTNGRHNKLNLNLNNHNECSQVN